MDRNKGWDILIKAIDICNSNGYVFECLFVGSGNELDVLKAFVNKYNLASRVRIIGPLNRNDLPDFYNSLDLFVFPTLLAESLGLVGIEALSCGVPVLCSGSGATKEYIIDGFNGFLYSPYDYSELSDKIMCLINNPLLLKHLKSNTVISSSNYFSSIVIKNLVLKLSTL